MGNRGWTICPYRRIETVEFELTVSAVDRRISMSEERIQTSGKNDADVWLIGGDEK